MRFLLVHSPTVGPSTWRWVAGALQSDGHEAIVPDLVPAAMTGDPRVFAQEAAEALDAAEEVVIVGHSAAGTVLPLVARLIANVRRVLFVDASVPPCQGTVTAGGGFQTALRGLATNGVLPVWSQWWGEGVLPALVRDDARRNEIEEELPSLPLAFFEAPISLPTGWCTAEGGFLLLSDFYRSDATAAATLGWPVVERPGAHLDMVNDEHVIAGLLVGLAEQP
jgi:hypothetical protein